MRLLSQEYETKENCYKEQKKYSLRALLLDCYAGCWSNFASMLVLVQLGLQLCVSCHSFESIRRSEARLWTSGGADKVSKRPWCVRYSSKEDDWERARTHMRWLIGLTMKPSNP